jgi:hypothetical protein
MKKILTHGKKLGFAAFIISELLEILLVLNAIFMVYKGLILSDIYISQIVFLQVSIFFTVWGAKASSNFMPKDNKDISNNG